MNNLGTKEQGTKVWNNILRKLDNSPKTTGITIKAPEFYNLSAYFRKVHPGRVIGPIVIIVTGKQIGRAHV